MGDGFPIVLTADRTLTAGYQLLFDGMLAASQTTTSPPALLAPLLMPRAPSDGVRARVAPLGLRRIEAALLAGGFGADQVVVADDAHLAQAIGPRTRIVGICSGEPAGLGMNSNTMAAVAGGRIYPQAMFFRLLRALGRATRKAGASPKVVLGGPGAWQAANDDSLRAALRIDHVVLGYAEDNAPRIFGDLLHGRPLPAVIEGGWGPASTIPPIRFPSTMGVVEISRGCGWGCSFCTISRVNMVHLPPATILSDVRTNVQAGVANIAAISEDFFRYGATGTRVNPEALMSLLADIGQVRGLGLIQIDHANIASIAQFSDEQLARVHRLLVRDRPHRYLWVNVGVETASGELLKSSGSAGKLAGTPADGWGQLCADQVRRLCAVGLFPMVSLIIGLPGETDSHVRQTLAWVRSLSNLRISVFPMLHAPIDGAAPPDPRALKPLHWELVRTCYDLNFRWIPRMYWDNQTAAGERLLRRLMLQILGRGQVLQWKALFALHSFRARTWR
jgi:radical SAM superfamily enzyme YgiQ (UPF0313 family)